MSYCEKHKDKERLPTAHCRHIPYYAVHCKTNLWCENKCEGGPSSGGPHFLDGTPAEKWLECDFPTKQTKCPKFKSKKWWQFWLR